MGRITRYWGTVLGTDLLVSPWRQGWGRAALGVSTIPVTLWSITMKWLRFEHRDPCISLCTSSEFCSASREYWERKGVWVEIEKTSSYEMFPESEVAIFPQSPWGWGPGCLLHAGNWNQPCPSCPSFTRNAWEVPPYPTSALSCFSKEGEDLGDTWPPGQGAGRREAVQKKNRDFAEAARVSLDTILCKYKGRKVSSPQKGLWSQKFVYFFPAMSAAGMAGLTPTSKPAFRRSQLIASDEEDAS